MVAIILQREGTNGLNFNILILVSEYLPRVASEKQQGAPSDNA